VNPAESWLDRAGAHGGSRWRRGEDADDHAGKRHDRQPRDRARGALLLGAILGSAITAGATLVRTRCPRRTTSVHRLALHGVGGLHGSFNMTAFITPDVQRNVIYPAGFTIDV
jgi:hypothetical protein